MSWYVGVDGSYVTGNLNNKFEVKDIYLNCDQVMNAGAYAIQPTCPQGNKQIFNLVFHCVDC